jgi:RND family efflux transporter MFP subunit
MSISPALLRLALPLAAAGLLLFAILSALRPGRAQTDPLLPPARASAANTVAGVGVVEPSSETIAVASELPGVVRSVAVRAGDRVEAGAPLFALDARALGAQLEAAKAAVAQAEAALAQARVGLEDQRARLALYDAVEDQRAVSTDEAARQRFAAERAQTQVQQAEAALRAARAQVRVVATDLERLTVRAPIAGRILRVNVRPGEFAPAGPGARPLLSMGADGPLHVRVEIDEADITRVRAEAAAEGALRGAADKPIALRFVRFEPEAVEKRALAGGAERVDTRVVQVLYAFEPDQTTPVFVGQRMDVFVAAQPLAVAAEFGKDAS